MNPNYESRMKACSYRMPPSRAYCRRKSAKNGRSLGGIESGRGLQETTTCAWQSLKTSSCWLLTSGFREEYGQAVPSAWVCTCLPTKLEMESPTLFITLMILPSLKTLETIVAYILQIWNVMAGAPRLRAVAKEKLQPSASHRTHHPDSILRSNGRRFRVSRHCDDFQVYLPSFTQKPTWHLQLWFPDPHDDFEFTSSFAAQKLQSSVSSGLFSEQFQKHLPILCTTDLWNRHGNPANKQTGPDNLDQAA